MTLTYRLALIRLLTLLLQTICGFYQRQGEAYTASRHILPSQIFCVSILVFTTWTESAFRKKSQNIVYRRFVHASKTLTDLQIWGCELHQNAFGGRALPGPARGAIALPRPPSRYSGRGERGREINIGRE